MGAFHLQDLSGQLSPSVLGHYLGANFGGNCQFANQHPMHSYSVQGVIRLTPPPLN